MGDSEMRKWIDNASYEELLRKWRFAPAGDPVFSGELALHYTKVMEERKKEVGVAGAVAASKAVGWTR